MMVLDARKLDNRTAAETHALEMAARRQEAAALTAALRVVARGVEAYALDNRGDARQMQWSERLRGIADQVERRWEATA
jgi:hypothetical protein